MRLSLHHDQPESESSFQKFRAASVLNGLKALDSRVRRKGIASLDPSRSALIQIGMEIDRNRVTANRYGVFNLAWQSEKHPEWPDLIAKEVEEIRARIRDTHKAPLQYLIWAGMGGSAEDKAMYQALGLLKRGPRLYLLDSTDPTKLAAIVADIKGRSRLADRDFWKRTLVVGMAMGMTSYEPVVNLERIAAAYEAARVDSTPNICYLTLPGSLLDKFAKPRGYRSIALQLDNANTTCGRHSGPLTRGSLYPLAFAGVDLGAWIRGANLSCEDVHSAWRLAAFLSAQAEAGRDKITLLLPKYFSGAALWTKQEFEESLGKSEAQGIKIVIGDPARLNHMHPPREARQDRAFLAVQSPELSEKIALLRRKGYPVAVLAIPAVISREAPLSLYMQFIHYTVFGVAWLRKMNFVTQPGVELYKSIANRIVKTKEGRRLSDSPRQSTWRGRVTLQWDRLPADVDAAGPTAPAIFAALLRRYFAYRNCEYGELTFFGDTRYDARGRKARAILDRAAETLYRAALKVPVDVYEGPAMNHSYHEMIIGHGKCFSTILMAHPAEPADYHVAQFLATQMALAERGRAVVSITLRDLEDASLRALDEFFRQAATQVRAWK